MFGFMSSEDDFETNDDEDDFDDLDDVEEQEWVED